MPSWLVNLLTAILIMSLVVVLIQIGPSTSVLDDQNNGQTSKANQATLALSNNQPIQILNRQTDWNELNQTTKTILQNEIENLKRLFQFTATAASHNSAADHLRNLTKTLDSLFVLTPESQQQIAVYEHQQQNENDNQHRLLIKDHQALQDEQHQQKTSGKLLDLNAILFLGLMFLILVLITLYLLNSWSSRLVRRASIQTKTADNHKQPYTISV